MKHIYFGIVAAVLLFTLQALPQTTTSGWTVTYHLDGTTTGRSFTFTPVSDGKGTFRFPTTTRTVFPAVWARPAPNRINFSAEVQLPVGTGTRESGALVFKGNVATNGTMSGPVVFVMDFPGPTAQYIIRTGTFTAVPLSSL